MKLKVIAVLLFFLTCYFIYSLTPAGKFSYATDDGYYLVSNSEDDQVESGDEDQYGDEDPYYDENEQGEDNSMDDYLPEEEDGDDLEQPEEDMGNDEITI